jgi:hypothetical protein
MRYNPKINKVVPATCECGAKCQAAYKGKEPMSVQPGMLDIWQGLCARGHRVKVIQFANKEG